MAEFKWLGPKVKCYNPGLRKGFFDFYKRFSYNNVAYNVGDFVFVQDNKRCKKICRLLCVYESKEKWHKSAPYRGLVRWYTWAKELRSAFASTYKQFDENEVVEDVRSKTDIFISLESILTSCSLIFGTEEDPVNVVQSNQLDPNIYFSCKYKIKDKTLIPISEQSHNDILLKEYLKNNLSFMTEKLALQSPENKESLKSIKSLTVTPTKRVRSSLKPRMIDVVTINLDSDTSDSEGEKNSFANLLKNSKSVESLSDCEEEINITNLLKSSESVELNPKNKRKHKAHSSRNCSVKRVSNDLLRKSPPLKKTPMFQCSLVSPKKDTPESVRIKLKLIEQPDKSNQKIHVNELDDTTLATSTKQVECSSQEIIKNDALDILDEAMQSLTNVSKKEDQVENEALNNGTEVSKQVNSCRHSSRTTRMSYTNFFYKTNSEKDVDITIPQTSSPNKLKRKINTSGKSLIADEALNNECKKHEVNSADKDVSNLSCEDFTEVPAKRGRDRPLKITKQISTNNRNDDLESSVTELKKNVEYNQNRTPKRRGRPRRTIAQANSNDFMDCSGTPTRRRSLRTSVLKQTGCTESDSDTPATPKSTPKRTCKDTPTTRMKMIREGVITPSVQIRKTDITNNNTPLGQARTRLHVAYIPNALACRENEYADIVNFLETKLVDNCGGCMYISGVPGTGKTATVTQVIQYLKDAAENNDIPDFKYININGLKLSEPKQAYVEICRQLCRKTVSWQEAQSMLEDRFVKSKNISKPIILLIDELDMLSTKRQDVIYNLLDWPTKEKSRLIVVTIANTMDLPERLLMRRVTSRMGFTRLTFQPYTHKQLQEIVTKRLIGINSFNSDAIQLVARKIASVSGDARRALDIGRRAVEVAELEGPTTEVTIMHVNEAINSMITQPKVQAIKHCSELEKLILQAVVAEVERTGVEETNFASVIRMFVTIAALNSFEMVSNTVAMAAVARLGLCRLLLVDQKSSNIHQKIILNVSSDDVYYALAKTDF